MLKQPKPSKDQRRRLRDDAKTHEPIDPKQIRRELGWELEEAERQERRRHGTDSERGNN
jgi:hypothetical protein